MKKYYFALTNNCNHSCEYCSCYSRPGKKTYLDFKTFASYINSTDERIEVQFEGGEPLIHPDFYKMMNYCIATNRCDKIIITTNSESILYEEELDWLCFMIDNPYTRFILKPSINYHLYKNEENLFDKMVNILHYSLFIPNLEVLFNVRLDKSDNDKIIMDEIEESGFKEYCNIFYFQRYGYASGVEKFELPFIIDNPVDFYLISPDGKNFGTDLIARSEHMKTLD